MNGKWESPHQNRAMKGNMVQQCFDVTSDIEEIIKIKSPDYREIS